MKHSTILMTCLISTFSLSLRNDCMAGEPPSVVKSDGNRGGNPVLKSTVISVFRELPNNSAGQQEALRDVYLKAAGASAANSLPSNTKGGENFCVPGFTRDPTRTKVTEKENVKVDVKEEISRKKVAETCQGFQMLNAQCRLTLTQEFDAAQGQSFGNGVTTETSATAGGTTPIGEIMGGACAGTARTGSTTTTSGNRIRVMTTVTAASAVPDDSDTVCYEVFEVTKRKTGTRTWDKVEYEVTTTYPGPDCAPGTPPTVTKRKISTTRQTEKIDEIKIVLVYVPTT